MYYNNLQRLLFQYRALVEQSNSLGLLNDAVNAENLFAAFLNKAFGWKLINANRYRLNQYSFDLIDKKNGIAAQVTSNKNHTSKFNKSISTFKETKNRSGIRHFIVFLYQRTVPGKF